MKPHCDCFQPQTLTFPLIDFPLYPFDQISEDSYTDFFTKSILDSTDIFGDTASQFFPSSDESNIPVQGTSSVGIVDPEALRDLTPKELQMHVDKNFKEIPTSSIKESVPPILRWITPPPERVHATSPSKLTEVHKPGGAFSFTVQLVSLCEDGTFAPYIANEDITLSVCVCGKNKHKGEKNGSKNSSPEHFENVNFSDLVVLHKNPIGKPLIVLDTNPNATVETIIRKGDSVTIFSGISLTCGSNAARSRTAPEAAKDWDWDYFLRVNVENLNTFGPLVSEHITTDSNRSQTREKKKRERPTDLSFPPAKKHASNFPITPYYNPEQKMHVSNVNPSSHFKFQNHTFSQYLKA